MPEQHHNSDYVDDGARVRQADLAKDDPEDYTTVYDITRIDRLRGDEPKLRTGHYAWLGDLAGFYLNGDYEGNLYLEHAKCGWHLELPRGGFAVTHTSPDGHDFGTFLANVVVAALQHKCPEAEQ